MPCEFHTYCIWRIKSYRNQNKTSGRGQDSCDSLSLLGTKPVWFCIPQALFSRSDGFCDASKAQLEGDYFALHWPLIGWTTWSLHSLSSTLVCLCKRQGKGHGRQKKKNHSVSEIRSIWRMVEEMHYLLMQKLTRGLKSHTDI